MLEQKMPKKGKYKAVIIGAGRIAAQFDSPESKEILTHAHAYCNNPKIDLMGFFDINKTAAKKAAKKWSCYSYNSLSEMFMKVKPDIVSICTNDECHFKVLMSIIKHKPRIVICEKPITTRLADTQKVISSYNKIKIPILVNYSRRFDNSVRKVKHELDEGKYGSVICASGIYTKGILHNGSHLIDLCCFLFGNLKRSSIFYSICDYNSRDKSLAGFMEFEKCKQFHLMAGDERKYSVFEFEIICEKRRIRFFDFGFKMLTEKVKAHPFYSGYKCLSRPIIKKTSLDRSLIFLINNTVDYLENNATLICDVKDAFKTQKICLSLLTYHKSTNPFTNLQIRPRRDRGQRGLEKG